VSPIRLLRQSFTPYELACIATLAPYVGFAIGALLSATTHHSSALWVMLVLAGTVAAFCLFASTCPECGKSPLRFYLTAAGERRGGEPMGGRAWPERECSHRRTRLDEA